MSPTARARWDAPVEYATDMKWPKSEFPTVEDSVLRRALEHAQELARVVRRGMGERRLSARQLALVAGVGRGQVTAVMDGTRWVQFSTVVPVLLAVGADLEFNESSH